MADGLEDRSLINRPEQRLTSLPNALAGRSLASVQEANVLRFPREYSLGTLYGIDHRRGISQEIGEAQGTVSTAGFPFLGLSMREDLASVDADLADLSGLTQLTELHLNETLVGDAGLAHLSGLTQLTLLYIGGMQVTNAGLTHLRSLTQLTRLGLEGTNVTDAGLAHLGGLTQLKSLDLEGSMVSPEGLRRCPWLPQSVFEPGWL